jgi:hypothetical protein
VYVWLSSSWAACCVVVQEVQESKFEVQEVQ